MTKPEMMMLLTEACQAQLGIVVLTNDPNKLRAKLYAVRKDAPEFANLSFVIPVTGDDDTLLIINKEPSDGES